LILGDNARVLHPRFAVFSYNPDIQLEVPDLRAFDMSDGSMARPFKL
jgi:hypothetical protein